MRTALLDSDILLYEIGFSSQQNEILETGEVVITPSSWDFTQALLEDKIRIIKEEAEADDVLFFLTNTPRINKMLNKKRVFQGEKKVDYKDNFRNEIAKEKVYKGTRKAAKPFHFYNLLAHILATYPTHIDESGLEADDAMCIEQLARPDETIICSRDKDLRQCSGWHYSWEVGKQASIGPVFVEGVGQLINLNEGKVLPSGKKAPLKVLGLGNKFFYYQLLTGDTVDNIGGIKGRGPAFAYNLLKDVETERECYELVAEIYVKTHGDDWKVKIKEQADLLWMVREVNEKGEPVLWLPPKKD